MTLRLHTDKKVFSDLNSSEFALISYLDLVLPQSLYLLPKKIAVVGVDNDTLVCKLTETPLSSVALSVEKSGYEAAELLDLMMKGRELTRKRITVHPTHVVARRRG